MIKRSKLDHKFADAYNNLGVVFYEVAEIRRGGKGIPEGDRDRRDFGVVLQQSGSGAVCEERVRTGGDGLRACLQLDPDVFERSSRGGVQAQLPSPGDRARLRLHRGQALCQDGTDSDRSLEYLRKAMEAGYKDFNNVYKDVEFAELRKDKRFVELMAAKPPAL